MGDVLIVVPGIDAGGIEALCQYILRQAPGFPGSIRIYLLDGKQGVVIPPDKSHTGMIVGRGEFHGGLSDLAHDLRTGAIPHSNLLWIPHISLLLGSGRDIRSIIEELQPGYSLAIGVRGSVPLLQKLIGKALFPDLADPYSDRFLMTSGIMEGLDVKEWSGPPLPHILAQIPPESQREFPWEDKIVETKRHCRDMASQVIGIGQILADLTRCREGMFGREMKTLVKFALVGISGIFVNTAILFFLTEYAHLLYLVSSAVAIETSILTNFFLNERWTFYGRACGIATRWKRLMSYNLLALGGMVVNMGVLFLLTQYAGVYYLLANIMGIFAAFSWNYVLNRNITWK